MAEYNEWRKNLQDDDVKQYTVIHHKGLASHTETDLESYFKNADQHIRNLVWEEEEEEDEIAIKKDIEERKHLIENLKPGTEVDRIGSEFTFSRFLEKELVPY